MKTVLPAVFAAALAAVFVMTPAAVSAQSPASAQTAPAQGGLPIQAVSDWLTTQGVTPGPVERENDQPYLTVQSDNLTWTLWFYGCSQDVCPDVQFSAGFVNAGVTPDLVNQWNGSRRYLKAYYEAPEGDRTEPAAVVQYDVILIPGADAANCWARAIPWRCGAPWPSSSPRTSAISRPKPPRPDQQKGPQ